MPKEGETNHCGLGITEGLFSTEYKILNLFFAGRINRFCPNIHVVLNWNVLSFGDFIEQIGSFPRK